MPAKRMLPNFLYIGPDKCGSSWLHAMLKSHPQAYVPDLKDIYFFDKYFDRGIDWYADFFSNCPPAMTAVGEISHDYLYSAEAANRIATHLPGVRLLAFLRDPVDRTFSHYLYLVRSGRTKLPFEDALERFPELIDNSNYHEHLAVYFDRFDRDQLGVFWFFDLEKDANSFAAKVSGFLGIEFERGLDYQTRVRPASRTRSALLARFAKKGATIARQMGLPGLVGAAKHSVVSKILYKPFSESDRPEVDADTAARLREQFVPGVLKLQQMVGKDLSVWMRNGEGVES